MAEPPEKFEVMGGVRAEVWQSAGTAPEFAVTPAHKRLEQANKREAWQSSERVSYPWLMKNR